MLKLPFADLATTRLPERTRRFPSRHERMGIDEALGDVADAAALVHAPRAPGIFKDNVA